MKPIRVGIIGTGGIATAAHIPSYQKVEGVEIVAGCDIVESVAKNVAEKFGIPRIYTDYRKMLKEEELDAVSVCTPNYVHMDPTIDALNAGVHVLCEKPIGMNAKEGAAMVAASRKTGKKLQIGLCSRFGSGPQALKRFIDAGELGDIYYARVQALRRRGIPGWGVFGQKDKQGGGPMIDIGVHILDLTLWLMGHPKPVAASGQCYTKFGTRKDIIGLMGQWDTETFTVEDFATGFVRFDNGATLTVEASFAANIEKDVFNSVILGTEGGLQTHPPMIFKEEHKTLTDVKPYGLADVNVYLAEVQAFIDAIRNDAESLIPGEHGLMVSQIMDAIYESSDTGKEVKIG
ncbi:MAG: Gfo/Idh/MocA family oxidoreductase [Armatimonadetes bacterium]|nr:Gfo/Idh/MocA family oxidoreductase [Armatimonadota bacterium]